MVNGIIIIILIVLLCFGIKSSIKHFKGEGSCCGGGSGAVKGKKPGKKKLDGPAVGHCTIRISGMHCQNCVNSVTKALNSIDGIAAKVSLRNKCAEVSYDRDIDKDDLIRAVQTAGFEVESIS